MGRGEFLEARHPPEPQHRPLSSSEWKVAVFSPIIDVATDLLSVLVANLFHRSAVGPQPVRDDGSGRAVALHGFLQEAQGR